MNTSVFTWVLSPFIHSIHLSVRQGEWMQFQNFILFVKNHAWQIIIQCKMWLYFPKHVWRRGSFIRANAEPNRCFCGWYNEIITWATWTVTSLHRTTFAPHSICTCLLKYCRKCSLVLWERECFFHEHSSAATNVFRYMNSTRQTPSSYWLLSVFFFWWKNLRNETELQMSLT